MLGVIEKNNELFEEQVRQHKLNERLNGLDLLIGDKNTITKDQTQRFETIHM